MCLPQKLNSCLVSGLLRPPPPSSPYLCFPLPLLLLFPSLLSTSTCFASPPTGLMFRLPSLLRTTTPFLSLSMHLPEPVFQFLPENPPPLYVGSPQIRLPTCLRVPSVPFVPSANVVGGVCASHRPLQSQTAAVICPGLLRIPSGAEERKVICFTWGGT